MAEGIPGPGWHQVIWQLRADEHSQGVPIQYLATQAACENPDRQVHVYHGLGADPVEIASGVRHLESLGVPAVGVFAPFYLVQTKHREHLAREVPGFVAESLSNGKVDLFGRSLGGFLALVGGAEAAERVNSVATLGSAGLTYNGLPTNATLRVMQFASQFAVINAAATLMRRPDMGDAAQLRSVAKELRSYGEVGGALEALRHGVGERVGRLVIDGAHAIHESGMPHQHYLGRVDGAFWLRHYRQSLGEIGCDDFTVIPGAHTNARSRAGKEQMEPYAAWVVRQRPASAA